MFIQSQGFTTGLLRIIAIMFVWNPPESIDSSTIVLAETGVDMNIFDDAKHLCSWCGLSPANNESAGKKKSVRIAKAGDYLKPMMVQCALAAKAFYLATTR